MISLSETYFSNNVLQLRMGHFKLTFACYISLSIISQYPIRSLQYNSASGTNPKKHDITAKMRSIKSETIEAGSVQNVLDWELYFVCAYGNVGYSTTKDIRWMTSTFVNSQQGFKWTLCCRREHVGCSTCGKQYDPDKWWKPWWILVRRRLKKVNHSMYAIFNFRGFDNMMLPFSGRRDYYHSHWVRRNACAITS